MNIRKPTYTYLKNQCLNYASYNRRNEIFNHLLIRNRIAIPNTVQKMAGYYVLNGVVGGFLL